MSVATTECGVDEVARGCLFGRVYAGAAVWADGRERPPLPKGVVIRDSKRMSARQRERAASYIRQHADGWAVGHREAAEIDGTNILRATLGAMHDALDALPSPPDRLAVDGTVFAPYRAAPHRAVVVPHRCIPHGDASHFGIACASILAKTAHDAYVVALCDADPLLDARYALRSNMGYGTAAHRAGIVAHGITPLHRRTFGPCRGAGDASEEDTAVVVLPGT